MAPDVASLADSGISFAEHPSKRRRVSDHAPHSKAGSSDSQSLYHHDDSDVVPPHPYGIRPLGNLLGNNVVSIKCRAGLLGLILDELLVQILDVLGPDDLQALQVTCKALYAFSRNEELWRTLFVANPPKNFRWHGTWRQTFLNQPISSAIDCTGLYSDVLHRPFFCTYTPLRRFTCDIPARNQIPRLNDLSEAEFNVEWYDKPFILTEPVKQWPVYRTWSAPSLLEKYHDTLFRAEAVDWPLHKYMSYMGHSNDESPLYLFDCRFAEKMGLNVSDKPNSHAAYWPPTCFGPDLFDVLDEERPDRRWLIVGPARSGSTFHKDPNATSAWNAVIRGSKYWIMFPSSANVPPPPGVYVSEDQSEVTAPLSIAEWLLGFHTEARKLPNCMEGICGEGEVLYVPSGWFHLVLNIEESVALTQNFIPKAHLGAALEFLRDRPEQISGFRDGVSNPYDLFVQKMRQKHPSILEDGLRDLAHRTEAKISAWETLTKPNEAADGFSFGFGGDNDDEYDDDVA